MMSALATIGLIVLAVAIIALIAGLMSHGMSRDCDFFTFWFCLRPAVEGCFHLLGLVLVAIANSLNGD